MHKYKYLKFFLCVLLISMFTTCLEHVFNVMRWVTYIIDVLCAVVLYIIFFIPRVPYKKEKSIEDIRDIKLKKLIR